MDEANYYLATVPLSLENKPIVFEIEDQLSNHGIKTVEINEDFGMDLENGVYNGEITVELLLRSEKKEEKIQQILNEHNGSVFGPIDKLEVKLGLITKLDLFYKLFSYSETKEYPVEEAIKIYTDYTQSDKRKLLISLLNKENNLKNVSKPGIFNKNIIKLRPTLLEMSITAFGGKFKFKAWIPQAIMTGKWNASKTPSAEQIRVTDRFSRLLF